MLNRRNDFGSAGVLLKRAGLIRIVALIGLLLGLLGMIFTSTFLGNQQKTKAATVTNPVPFGTELGLEFVNMVRNGFRAQAISGAPTLTFDATGWPQADFEYIFTDARHNMGWDGPDFNGTNPDVSGTYHLSFKGQATLSVGADNDSPTELSFQNVNYDTNSNTTTADVVVAANHWLLAINFTQTKRNPSDTAGNGVTAVRMIRPGYAADSTQLFTDRFISALQQLHPATLRTFDSGTTGYNIWNGTTNPPVLWADRSLTTDAYWPLPAKNVDNKRGLGLPWEYYIQLCNQLNADPWINVPVSADDDYITQLATLFKNTLNPGLHVYVENANEVWNFGAPFTQSVFNQIQANAEGISIEQRYVEHSIQISNLFRGVYGDSAMNTTVRTVAVWQYSTELQMQDVLTWAQARFNNPVNHYLYGIGEAPYLDPDLHGTATGPDAADPNAVNRILDTLYTSAGEKRKVFTEWQTVATYFGLHEVGYESGPSLNAGIDGDVTRSPRMNDLVASYFMNDYFATGAEAVNFFAFGEGTPNPSGDWYSFENYATRDSYGKWLGMLAVAGQARPAITVGNVLPSSVNGSVVIDASQYVVGDSHLNLPGSVVSAGSGSNLDYLLRVPNTGTYSITLTGHTNNAAAQVNIQVDNNSLGTVSLPQTTDGTSSAVSVSLSAGLHTLVLTGAGSGNTIYATGGGISFTLTSGGGTAVVPSAPLNVKATAGDQQTTLTWENVTTASSYTIKRSTNSGGPYSTIGTATSTTYTDTGLSNGSTYYYVVTASNTTGESAISPQVVALPVQAVVPATPGNIVATSGGSAATPFNTGGQVRITWNAVPNATSYKIKKYNTSSNQYELVRNQPETIYHEDNLSNGTMYKYEISAVNPTGESANTAEIDLTPQITVPDAPTNLVATPGNGTIALKWLQAAWQFPAFNMLFTIKRGPSASGPFTTVLSVSTNNVTDLGLTNGTQYCYVVAGNNSAGDSVNSAAQCATPNGSIATPTPTPGTTPTPGVTPTPGTTPTPGVTPTSTPGGSWTACATEGGTCSFSGTALVRYGITDHYVYQTATGSIACTNAAFGSDPAYGTTKSCDYQSSTPTPTATATATATPGGGTWTHCANEGGTCTFSGTHQVRYGASGQYFYQNASGSIGCNNTVFGDPLVGTFKSCDYQ